MPLPYLIRLQRQVRELLRPSHERNRRALAARGESLDRLTIRDVRAEEIGALAELHAVTWADTYPTVLAPPTAALRETQWRQQFARQDGSWFCLVVVAPDARLVGFAKGNRFAPADAPEGYQGQLNKIYLLRDYQRLGLGTRLTLEVVKRFLAMGITSMCLFADEGNPTCAFYEALGGMHLKNADGTTNNGNYGWRDLEALRSHLEARIAGTT